jgi:glycosyltransferase involved in cell wall biosynthesis
MIESFEIDPYPGKPRMLFIGLGSSTHTQAWINLLSDSDLNVRLFALPDGGMPPADWKVRTYLPHISQYLPEGLDLSIRKILFPSPEDIKTRENKIQLKISKIQRNPIYRIIFLMRRMLNLLGSPLGLTELNYDLNKLTFYTEPERLSPEEWLSAIIRDWRPQIIQTLGLFDGQGGEFYYKTRKAFRLEKFGKWVLQLRGGSDIALRQHNPETAKQLLEILSECDEIVTDNHVNIHYIQGLGLGGKIASISPVPGTGGIEVERLASIRTIKASQSQEIVFPKGYELAWSKCLPVFEAFKLCWEQITPCKIHILNITPEIRAWFYALPAKIQESCILHDRMPREDFMSLLAQARVLLIPSLVDGVPNSLYEAMALGTFPIVSPLDTICPIVEAEKNVLFARNLYPEEISQALVRAMSEDELVENAVHNNLELVEKLASQHTISRKVIEYYKQTTDLNRKENSIILANYPLVTVITPTYNRADYVAETIESVLTQDYPNIEYIVLDDGSKDNTLEILNKYKDKIILEGHPNMGENATVNRGFEMAKGEFICVVNSDDPLLPGAIIRLVAALMSEPEALAAYPDWVEIDPQSKAISELKLPEYDIHNMLTSFSVGMGPGNIFPRSVLEKYGYRDAKRKYTGDLEFWFRLASHGKLVHVPEFLATHRTHPQSASVTDKSSKISEELLSMVKSVFASGSLPTELQDKRGIILSHVYSEVTFYCPNEPAKKLKYSLFSFLYNPRPFLKKKFKWMFNKLLNIYRRVF